MKFKLEVTQDTLFKHSVVVAVFEVDADGPNLATNKVGVSEEFKAIQGARISTISIIGELPKHIIK